MAGLFQACLSLTELPDIKWLLIVHKFLNFFKYQNIQSIQ